MFKRIFREFRNFAMRGNAVDMAVGVIIGTAFGKIVDSLVKDIIMPPICLLLGKIDLDSFFWVIKKGSIPHPYSSLISAREAGAVTINYGTFIDAVANFFIVSICVFALLKLVSVSRIALAPDNTIECPYCKSKISSQASRCPHCTSVLSNAPEMTA